MDEYIVKCYSGKLGNCPKCKSTDIIIADCGHEINNRGEAKCKNCNFSININCSTYPAQEIANAWNETVDFLHRVEKWRKEDLINYVKASYLNSSYEFREIISEKAMSGIIFKEKCSICHGFGTIMKRQGFLAVKSKCDHCHGTGEF